MFVSAANKTYFDSFGVEDIAKEIRKLIRNKNITTNIYRIQAYKSIIVDNFVLDLFILCIKVKDY